MNSQELKKYLSRNGTRFEPMRGGTGHQWAIRGSKRTIIPSHGNRKELGTGLVNKILKDLGLK